MANLTINNLPDELMAKTQQLANQNNRSLSQQVIVILKEVLQEGGATFLISPDTDPTWE